MLKVTTFMYYPEYGPTDPAGLACMYAGDYEMYILHHLPCIDPQPWARCSDVMKGCGRRVTA